MNDREEIELVVLNYIEGWYEANADKMQKALHSDLVKRKFVSLKEIWQVDTKWMLQATKEGKGSIPNPPAGKKQMTILDLADKMASVKLISEKFIDYLHLVKIGRKWSIVDALWDYRES